MKTVKIKLLEKEYEVKREKLEFVLKKLTGKGVEGKSDEEIIKMAEKCKLIDEGFLEGVNKI